MSGDRGDPDWHDLSRVYGPDGDGRWHPVCLCGWSGRDEGYEEENRATLAWTTHAVQADAGGGVPGAVLLGRCLEGLDLRLDRLKRGKLSRRSARHSAGQAHVLVSDLRDHLFELRAALLEAVEVLDGEVDRAAGVPTPSVEPHAARVDAARRRLETIYRALPSTPSEGDR